VVFLIVETNGNFSTIKRWEQEFARMKVPTKKVSIAGNEYTIRTAKLRKNHGECDSPRCKNPEIRIKAGLDQKLLLEVLLHEMLHASAWLALSEEYVTVTARDMSHILYDLGWRNDGFQD